MPRADRDDITRNYHGGADTSIEAHDALRSKKQKILKSVLKFIEVNGPCTCEEIENGLELSHQTASARVTELMRDQFIEVVRKVKNSRNRSVRQYQVAPVVFPKNLFE